MTGQPTATDRRGLCSWCKRFSNSIQLIQIDDAGSGPAMRGLYACGPCREVHRLVPLADRP
ncbi:hypothetical protein CTZ28_42960 [Streptomyces shenzhenensis]|uniref:Uncharacterized protein n=2 Tax=Streptomyces shenzhenensis TaxID=943815 RepID=A0A3M0HUT7_9ACTN|nr:hypothetical protein CTZ28_42960 [Streptomyces shenzhenensis]